jgi:DNA invertase Pin-like site-specific DNA recombinase
MKVVLYCRVSTEEQAGSGVSLEVQEAKLRAYAELFDLEVAAVVVDAGESAKSLKRPGLQRALTMLDSGQADGICVTKLCRLTRSVSDWQTLIQNYFSDKAGKQLLSVSDSIDTRSAAGRLVLNVLMSVAAWEREVICERTREALGHKIANHQRVGKVRYGYELGPDGRTLVENPAEQEVIEVINILRTSGYSLQGIAAELNRRAIPTKSGSGPWIYTAVNRILKRSTGRAA